MEILGYALVAFVAVIFSAVISKPRCKRSRKWTRPADVPGLWPYYQKKVLTDPEHIFYLRLVEALPQYYVLPQVGLSRVIETYSERDKRMWFKNISRMSLDYVICTKEDFSVIAAIELDDATHRFSWRKEADERKRKALNSARIELIRWRVDQMPSVAEIRKTFTLPENES